MSEQKEKRPELHSDAWSRFERAVDVVAKSPPQHKKTKAERDKKAEKQSERRKR